MTRNYFLRLGDLTSAALNTALFNGECDESTSGRSWRREQEGSRKWGRIRRGIDFLFRIYETDHCRKAYQADLERAHRRLQKARQAGLSGRAVPQ